LRFEIQDFFNLAHAWVVVKRHLQNTKVRVVRFGDVELEKVSGGQALLADAAGVTVDGVVVSLAVDQLRKRRLQKF
jgi:hypothetical protein